MSERYELHLDKNSAVPLYEQLRRRLLDAITGGQFPEGAKLPTEEELCQALGRSRPVVRRAYNALLGEGGGERQRGRATIGRVPGRGGSVVEGQRASERT